MNKIKIEWIHKYSYSLGPNRVAIPFTISPITSQETNTSSNTLKAHHIFPFFLNTPYSDLVTIYRNQFYKVTIKS